MEKLNFEHKKAWITGLLIDCPLGKALDNCPAKEARTLPISDRINLVRSMDAKQIDQIIAHHQGCPRQREDFRLGQSG